MKLSIIGLGYVGLSLSVLLSQKFKVVAVHADAQKVDKGKRGISPIADPDISDFFVNRELGLKMPLDFEALESASAFYVIAPQHTTAFQQTASTCHARLPCWQGRAVLTLTPQLLSKQPSHRLLK